MPVSSGRDPAAAGTRLEQIAPGYLERVRNAASSLGVRNVEASDLRAALLDVEDLSEVDIDIPIVARRAPVRALKAAVKRLVGWYLSYLAKQVTAFGQAVTHLGTALSDRTEALEGSTRELRAQVVELAERVDRLERDGR